MSNASDFVIENSVLKKYVGSGTKVVIPEGVTEIGQSAFSECKGLKSVVIPNGTKIIGTWAFYGCKKLKSIIIPEGVTEIGKRAFYECNMLSDIVLPEGLTLIDEFAFFRCSSLEQLVIPEGVIKIADSAFLCCNKLKTISFPSSLTMLGKRALDSCSELVRINAPSGEWKFPINAIGKNNAQLRFNINTPFRLPAALRINAVLCYVEDNPDASDYRTKAYYKYLHSNSEKQMELFVGHPDLMALMCREKLIPANCTDAYMNAVQKKGDAELIAMMLDYSGKRISNSEKEKAQARQEKQEDEVFMRMLARECKEGIEGLNFVVTGYVYTFDNRSKMKAFIESKGARLVSSISSKVDYLISNDVSDDEKDTEKYMTAKKLGISVITEREFNKIAGREFIVENGQIVKYMGPGGDVVIPDGITRIGPRVFKNFGILESVTIPDSVKIIGEEAFKGCTGLTNLVIPDSVTSIGYDAFSKCKSLESITLPARLTAIATGLFSGCSRIQNLLIPDGVTEIKSEAFKDCSDMKNLVIPHGVTDIGEYVFRNCSSLTEIVIPKGVSSISTGTFYNCTSLERVVIPGSVEEIFYDAFGRCIKLKNIAIPEGVRYIDPHAFSGCTALESVPLQESVSDIIRTLHSSPKLSIHAPAGSYAEQYAKENNIPFVAE